MTEERKYPYRAKLSNEGLRKLTELAKWRRIEKNSVLEILIDDAYDRMKADTADIRL